VTVVGRRSVVGALGSILLAACSGAPPVPPKRDLPPLAIDDLAALVPAAGLSWLVLARPREIAQISWLIPAIAAIAPEENLRRFAADTGVDLRELPEALIARFGPALGDADLEIVRHTGDGGNVERLFRKRIVKDARRDEDRPDLVRVSGQVGAHPQAVGRMGRDVVAFQQGGDVARGPLRIAALYAMKRIKKAPPALSVEPWKSLRARFGRAPLVALAQGPFGDDWKKGARGLLEVATGVGGALRPTAREHLGVAVAIAGDFRGRGGPASETLALAWDDLASAEMGRILGLDRPIERPLATFTDDAVALSVEIEPNRFAEGLRALVTEDVRALMRL
jgi:hypothetical protein